MIENKLTYLIKEDVAFVDSIREVKDLAKKRANYNCLFFCNAGRIVVEFGGEQQVKVLPGQLLLVPAGKLVQPMLVSTDVEAQALLISDRVLKAALLNQVDIWNKAMYMRDIYVVEGAEWQPWFSSQLLSISTEARELFLYEEILMSFIRLLFLLICETLRQHENMAGDDTSAMRDKDLFNRFLSLLERQERKFQPVSVYAEQLHITPKYLSTVCKRVSGKSPKRWITEGVMEDCYRMLAETDLAVKEIAFRQGFPNSSFFGQYFKEEAGQTPLEFRNERIKR